MISDETPDQRLARRRRRPCLSCAKAFDSAWAGERICPHCKNSTVWREDLAGSTANHARYSGKARSPGGS